MFKPAKGIEGGHGLERPTNGVNQGIQGGPPTTSDERLEFGEHHLNRIEIWTVGREVQQGALSSFDQGADGSTVMGGEVVHHDDLAWLKGWTEVLAHVPLEGIPIDRSWNDQRGHRPREAESADQGLVQAVIAGHLSHGAKVTGCAGVQPNHGGVETTLVQKNEPGGCLKVGCELVQERQTAFLTPLASDQRFFYM
jgi:hypothetical protein